MALSEEKKGKKQGKKGKKQGKKRTHIWKNKVKKTVFSFFNL